MGTELSPSNFSKEASREGRKNCQWDACLVTIFISHEPPVQTPKASKMLMQKWKLCNQTRVEMRDCRPAAEL